MRLEDLSPHITPPGGEYQQLIFQCPRCRGHEIMVSIWGGSYGEHRVKMNGAEDVHSVQRLWHAEQGPAKDWGSLTLTPSIDRSGIDKCGGWHGFITNGEVT